MSKNKSKPTLPYDYTADTDASFNEQVIANLIVEIVKTSDYKTTLMIIKQKGADHKDVRAVERRIGTPIDYAIDVCAKRIADNVEDMLRIVKKLEKEIEDTRKKLKQGS